MIDLFSLLEFSRQHCLTICAVLVPLNLAATLTTLILVGLNQPWQYRIPMIALASLFAGMMVLHVLTWFIIGVVMAPTYVLLSLGAVCLGLNAWAGLAPHYLRGSFITVGRSLFNGRHA
jgi:hypothetical protein